MPRPPPYNWEPSRTLSNLVTVCVYLSGTSVQKAGGFYRHLDGLNEVAALGRWPERRDSSPNSFERNSQCLHPTKEQDSCMRIILASRLYTVFDILENSAVKGSHYSWMECERSHGMEEWVASAAGRKRRSLGTDNFVPVRVQMSSASLNLPCNLIDYQRHRPSRESNDLCTACLVAPKSIAVVQSIVLKRAVCSVSVHCCTDLDESARRHVPANRNSQ